MSGTFELRGFGLQGRLRSRRRAEFLRREARRRRRPRQVARWPDAQQTADTDFAETGVNAETRAKIAASGGGVDVASAQSRRFADRDDRRHAAERVGGATALTYSVGGGVGEATLTGLRAREIAEAWKYLVAHGDDKPPIVQDFSDKLRAALPLWTEFQGRRQAQRRRGEGAVRRRRS